MALTERPGHSRVARTGKRTIDVIGSVALLLLLSPLLVIVAVLVRVTSPGPALFRQERVGTRGRTFTMVKFRTMVVNDDDSALREAVQGELDGTREEAEGSFKLHDDPRVTPVGRWLRRTSFDEVPQLFNVLLGHMSLVGPRPALPWEAALFPPELRRREEVLPGLTGLWQVSGRSRLGTPDMLRLDVEYVDTWSLGLDLSILVRTVPVLLRGDGAR
jgi:lipopolysaccharide/colanic/teichoic acid biosynthesis glycosyltransferase